eukprot:403352801
MAANVDPVRWQVIQQDLQRLLQTSDYQQNRNHVQEQIINFMKYNPNCNIEQTAYQEVQGSAVKKCIQLRGKLLVQLQNSMKVFGFKIVVTSSFPFGSPHAFLDEPEIPSIYEYIDYLVPVNRISIKYLDDWPKFYQQSPNDFSLQALLIQINNFYTRAPPIDIFEEVKEERNILPANNNFINLPSQLNNNHFNPAPLNKPVQKQHIEEDNPLNALINAPVQQVHKNKPAAGMEFDELLANVDQNGMSHDQRMSLMVLNSQIQNEKDKESKKPSIVSNLKPKVVSILQEFVLINQSQAEVHLQKLEKLIKNNEQISRALGEIKLKNEEVKASTREINLLASQLEVSNSKLDLGDVNIETIRAKLHHVMQKLIYYDAKISALNDCLAVLKNNESISVVDNIKIHRKLSSKQFRLQVKRNKLAIYIQININNLRM